jgi:site-specific DNA recombinase
MFFHLRFDAGFMPVSCAPLSLSLARCATRGTFEQKRQLVELLIDRVVVTMEDVEIRYVIPTSPSSEQIRFCHLLTDYSGAE